MDKAGEKYTDDLESELRGVKKAFEVLLLAIEAEGIESASEIAGRIVDRMDHIVREMRNGYVQRVLEKRFQPFTDDSKRFREMRGKDGKRSSDEFIDLVSRLEKHIATVDREMRMLVPQEAQIVSWSRRHWRMIAAGCAVALLAAGVWTGANRYVTRGKGLMGEYYSGTNFRKLVAKRRDLSIDFSLRNKAPIRGLTFDNYSVRWTGFIRIPEDGVFEFITRSDDGVKLWINDEVVIDNWTIHRQMTDKATKQMTAGVYPIKLEWFQRRGPALMQLYWRAGGDAQPRLIEPENLLPRAQ